MSKEIKTVIFTEKKTGKLLKRFDYPAHKLPNKFFWEKLKQQELLKLLKARELQEFEVKVSEYSVHVERRGASYSTSVGHSVTKTEVA